MLAVLELELIGDNYYASKRANAETEAEAKEARYGAMMGHDKTRPWVAHLTGLDPKYGLRREFVRAQQKDYSRANSIGSRGVFLYFVLQPGFYEVHERQTWKRTRRYFCHVEGDKITEIDRDEVVRCLNGC